MQPLTYHWQETNDDGITWTRSAEVRPEGVTLLSDDEVAALNLNDPAARIIARLKAQAEQAEIDKD